MAAIPVSTYRDALICFTNPLEKFDFARLTMPVLMMTASLTGLPRPPKPGVAEPDLDASKTPDVQFEVIPGRGLCLQR